MANSLQQVGRLMLLASGMGLLCLGGCGGGDGSEEESLADRIPPASEEVTTHPVEERIPYHDREAIPITKEQSVEAMPDPPRSLQVMASWLRDPQAIDTTHLGFFIKWTDTFDVASIGPKRLVLFNGHDENRLFEHNLRTGETIQIAEPGNGPGELQFAYDLARDGRSVYVARQDRRLDRFTCEPIPCEYGETMRLPIQAMSVARRPQGLAVLAHPSYRGGERGKKAGELSGAIHLLNEAGTVQRAFGMVYLSNRAMVLSNYSWGSDLTYSGQFDKYVLTNSELPYVWLYDNTGNIDTIFEINEFRSPEIKYNPKERSVTFVESEKVRSIINEVSILNDRFLVVGVQRRGSDVQQDRYYAVDLKTSEPYFIGTDTYGEDVDTRAFFVTDHHQVLVENGAVTVVEEQG